MTSSELRQEVLDLAYAKPSTMLGIRVQRNVANLGSLRQCTSIPLEKRVIQHPYYVRDVFITAAPHLDLGPASKIGTGYFSGGGIESRGRDVDSLLSRIGLQNLEGEEKPAV